MLEAQGKVCAATGCENRIGTALEVLGSEGAIHAFICEHTLPVALGNQEKPDCLLCLNCASLKTKADVRRIAKTKRQKLFNETGRSRKRKGRPFEKGKTKWPKRSFSSSRGFK